MCLFTLLSCRRWHSDEAAAVADVRKRLVIIMFFDAMVFGYFIAAMRVVSFSMNKLSLTILAAARIFAMRRLGAAQNRSLRVSEEPVIIQALPASPGRRIAIPPPLGGIRLYLVVGFARATRRQLISSSAATAEGFQDAGLTIAGAQMAVTTNLFFLALGASTTAVLSYVDTTYVCTTLAKPSEYWWYMARALRAGGGCGSRIFLRFAHHIQGAGGVAATGVFCPPASGVTNIRIC